MTQPEAVIFDLDGVLADTVEYHYRAWQQIAALLDVPFDRAMMNQFRGRRRQDCLRDLLGERQLSDAEFERYMILKDDIYLQDVAQMTADSLLPGVLSFIAAAHEQGLKLGVASSSQSAKLVLEKTELLPYMAVVGDGTTVQRPKPAPDIFVWVAGALRVRPARAVVFEDSQAGVQAACTAGMFVVGVGEEDFRGRAHLCVAGLHDLQVADLLAQARTVD